VTASLLTDRIGYDPAPYLQDLHTLEDSAAAGYANLDWQVQRGVVDPVALHQRTESRLRAAGSRAAARAALTAFAAAFEDGHFRARRPTPALIEWVEAQVTGARSAPPSASDGAAAGCAALGYRDDRSPSPLAKHPTYRQLGTPDDAFAIGTLDGRHGSVGVLRLDAFGVTRFGTVCAGAWPEAIREAVDGHCLEQCQDRLWLATSDSLLAELTRSINRLADAGIGALVVDLRGNGGGNDWVAPAARLFTGKALHGHHAGVVRHPHHLAQLTGTIEELTRAAAATTDSAWRGILVAARKRAEAQLAEVRTPCDRRAIWRQGIAAVPCSPLATQGFTTGFVEYLPATMRGMPGAATAFAPLRFRYEEGIWQGPVVLLIDRGTASASEDFVVTLKDAGVARLFGQRTYGAGCGFTDGGIGFTLPHSGLRVEMPDCARIRRNGMNEVAGIEPDVTMPVDATVEQWLEAIVGGAVRGKW
jgi:hypothetical protein